MEEARFHRGVFRKAHMLRAVVIGTDMRWSDFRDAELTGMAAEESNFAGADFTGANLSGASLTRARMIGARFNGAKMENVRSEGTDFRGATGLGKAVR